MQSLTSAYVIATGQTGSLNEFVKTAFEAVGLDWRQHLEMDTGLFRPTDIAVSRMNPEEANRELGWEATFGLKEIIDGMLETHRVGKATVH